MEERTSIVWISAVYWSDMTEAFKSFFDRLRRCDATCSHYLADKRCVLIACAGGTGRGTLASLNARTGSYVQGCPARCFHCVLGAALRGLSAGGYDDPVRHEHRGADG